MNLCWHFWEPAGSELNVALLNGTAELTYAALGRRRARRRASHRQLAMCFHQMWHTVWRCSQSNLVSCSRLRSERAGILSCRILFILYAAGIVWSGGGLFSVGCFDSLRWADLEFLSAAPQTHIVNGRLYGATALSLRSIFTPAGARQDRRRGIWSSHSRLANSAASQSLHN